MTTRTRFRDCLQDPGPLTVGDAAFAVSIHHDCPELCRWRWRALAAIDTAVEMQPGPADYDDEVFADRLRMAAGLMRQAREQGRVSGPIRP